MRDIQAEVNELLARAMQQPGVAEVADMYASQKAAMDVLTEAQDATAPRWVVFTSTSSTQQSL